MKKISTLIALTTICLQIAFSQETEIETIETEKTTKFRANEVKISLTSFLFSYNNHEIYPEIEYERLFSSGFGLGLAGALSFADPNIFHIMPYGRAYFFTGKWSAFFIETHVAMLGHYYWSEHYDEPRKVVNALGLGLGIGSKIINKDNIVCDMYLGIGRRLNAERYRFYPRVGVTLGYRF